MGNPRGFARFGRILVGRFSVGFGDAVLALGLGETDVLAVSGKRLACLLGDFVLRVGVLDRLVIVRL